MVALLPTKCHEILIKITLEHNIAISINRFNITSKINLKGFSFNISLLLSNIYIKP